MSEALKCPECSGAVIRDAATGEKVCASCGFVVEEEPEYVPDFVPKTIERGSFAYAGLPATGKPTRYELIKYCEQRYLYMIGRSGSRDRIVTDIAAYVQILTSKTGVNRKVVEEEAMRFVHQILRLMREKRRRLMAEEIAAVALWHACKTQSHPVTFADYEAACRAVFGKKWGGKSLLKLVNKVRDMGFTENGKYFEFKDYVWRFAAKLRSNGFDAGYVDTVAVYAARLCDAVKGSDELEGKNPACVAAAAMRFADDVMGGWIGRERLKEALGVGFNKEAYGLMRVKAPPVPASLRERALACLKKRVMEVKKNEVVGNVAC